MLVTAVLLRLAANWPSPLLHFLVYAVLSLEFTVDCIHVYVSLVALLYCCGVYSPRAGAARRAARADPLMRLRGAFLSLAVPVLAFYTYAAWVALRQLDAREDLQLLGGALYIAGAGCVAVACQLACVVWVLDDAGVLGGMWRSRVPVPCTMFFFLVSVLTFFPLYACIVSGVVMWAVVRGYLPPLGLAFQLPVALCVVLAITLMAQPLVYRACKKPAHLDHAGE
ncbi:hypothetical protein VPH35_131563 [Triticum aestivum]